MKKLLLVTLCALLSFCMQSQDTVLTHISSLQFPFKLSIKKLEQTANQAIKGIIYKDSLYTDDQMKCTVWKDDEIKLSSIKNNVLRVDLPLKVWIEKGIGALGAYTYKSSEFKLTMSFHLVYSVSNDWKLITKTFKNGYTWTQKPSLNFVTIQLPITPLVEKILDKKQGDYAKLIDDQISNNLKLKDDMIKVWNQLKEPQKVSDSYNTWLAIIPQAIFASPFTQDENYIKSSFHLKALVRSCIGYDSALKTPVTYQLPPLIYKNLAADSFKLYTMVTIPYSEASQIAKKKFVDQEFSFNNGKYNINIHNIALYNNQGKLMIETDISGSLNGKTFIQGELYYQADRRTVRMRNLAFDLHTKNIFHKAASWLFNGKIEQNLEEKFEMPVGELLDYCSQSADQALNRNQNGMRLSGKLSQLTPTHLSSKDSSILLILLATGQLAIEF
jgi:hypothetical protein